MAGIVKSVQNIVITIAAGSTTGTASIAAVNNSSTEKVYDGVNEAGTTTNPSVILSGFTLSGTTLTATRNTSDASFACTLNCTLTEYIPSAIKSIQDGTVSLSAAQTSNTATISSVTTTNSSPNFNGSTTASVGTVAGSFPAVVLTNATTITGSIATASVANTIYFSNTEFNSGVLNSSTQAISISCSSAAGTTGAVSAVTAAQCRVAYGGCNNNQNDGCDLVYETLTNGTTMTAFKITNFGATLIKSTVVEHKSANITSVNRGTVTVAGSSQNNTATFSAVNTALAALNQLGISDASQTGSVWISGQHVKNTLTNSTTVTVGHANAGNTNSSAAGWEVTEYVKAPATSGMFSVL